jgi:hypothetical protein
MLATLIQSAPVYDAAWWLAALWLFRTLCLWSFFWANCPCCDTGVPCTNVCIDDNAPASLTVTITGVAGSALGCASCSVLNGTYLLPFDTQLGATNCRYKFTMSNCTGVFPFLYAFISDADVPGEIRILIRFGTIANYDFLSGNQGSPPIDCFGIFPMTIPFTSTSSLCTGASASAYVET